jgi:hypothetical protein
MRRPRGTVGTGVIGMIFRGVFRFVLFLTRADRRVVLSATAALGLGPLVLMAYVPAAAASKRTSHEPQPLVLLAATASRTGTRNALILRVTSLPGARCGVSVNDASKQVAFRRIHIGASAVVALRLSVPVSLKVDSALAACSRGRARGHARTLFTWRRSARIANSGAQPSPPPAIASANAVLPASAFGSFSSVQFPGNDDGSWPCGPSGVSAPVPCTGSDTGPEAFPFGFNINFYGTDYGGAYVNNNGNVTFGTYLSRYTPFGLPETGTVIIAPFFADVDTRVGNAVEIGTGTLDGYKAFVVNWSGVGCFPETDSVTDNFQLILIDRPDLGSGPAGDDFQIEFNYDSIQWDAGQASGGNSSCTGAPNADSAVAGFSTGTTTPGDTYQFPGSQTSGAFLDSNSTTGLIYNSVNSSSGTAVPVSSTAIPGRYIFNVENGTPIVPGSLALTLTASSSTSPVGQPVTLTASVTDVSGNPVPNVPVNLVLSGGPDAQAGTTFQAVNSDANGHATFSLPGLSAGTDIATASIAELVEPVTATEQVQFVAQPGDLTATPNALSTSAGTEFRGNTLATFTDPKDGGTAGAPGDFSARVDWNDPDFYSSVASVSGAGRSPVTFKVTQSFAHVFCTPGTYSYVITITDKTDGESVVVPGGSVTVARTSTSDDKCAYGELIFSKGNDRASLNSGRGCSGTMVDSPSSLMVITAAHCLDLKSDGTVADHIAGFVPAVQRPLGSDMPFGIWTSRTIFINPLYSKGGNTSADAAYDYAYVKLDANSCFVPSEVGLGTAKGQCPSGNAVGAQFLAGGLQIEWSPPRGSGWFIFNPTSTPSSCNPGFSNNDSLGPGPDLMVEPCKINDATSAVPESGGPWIDTSNDQIAAVTSKTGDFSYVPPFFNTKQSLWGTYLGDQAKSDFVAVDSSP